MTPNETKDRLNNLIYRERVHALQDRIESEGWSGLLVLGSTDIAYLTGLNSSNAAVIVTKDRSIVATDFRYVAEAQSLGLEVASITQSMWSDLGSLVSSVSHEGPLAYSPSSITHKAFLQFTEALDSSVSLRAVDNVVADFRVVKNVQEIKAVDKASKLLNGAYELVASCRLLGRSEGEVAWMIERHLREAGASSLSFPSIVAGGKNGAYPHHSPAGDLIPDDTLVTVDIGCVIDGYCSDCTRTFAVGNPSDKLREIYDVTLKAQIAALDAVRAGANGRDIDLLAREVISTAGYGDYFGHGLGHGVGMDVHESPRLSRTSNDTLAANMLVTVEPGIYIPELGGVRIEDLVVVSEGACEILTTFPKELMHA